MTQAYHAASAKLLAALLLLPLVGTAAPAQETAPAAGKPVDLNGMQMYYGTHGAGEPLVLLHGFGGSGSSAWGRFIPELAKSYQVIVPDLRGHGRSTNPANQFTHRQAALDVFALLDQLGVKKAR